MATGAAKSTINADETSTQTTSEPTGVPCISARDARASRVTGFLPTIAWSQSGIVESFTKMSLANVSGMRKRKLHVITDSGDFTSMPTMIQGHETAKQKTSTSATADSTPSAPPFGLKPKMKPTTRMTADATE